MTYESAPAAAEDFYVLLWGLQLAEESLVVGEGLTLKKLNSELTFWDLLAAGASGFRESSIIEPFVRGCVSEIHSSAASAKTPGYNTLNRAWLVSALLTLRGFTRHLGLAVSTYSWDVIAGHHKRNQEKQRQWDTERRPLAGRPPFIANVPDFKGSLLDYHLKLQLNSKVRTDSFSNEDADWMAAYFDTANKLSTDAKFHFALAASTDWRVQEDERAAIARLWSGIEALLNVESELSYRIAVSAALPN